MPPVLSAGAPPKLAAFQTTSTFGIWHKIEVRRARWLGRPTAALPTAEPERRLIEGASGPLCEVPGYGSVLGAIISGRKPINTSTSMGRLTLNMLLSFAQAV